MLARITRWLRDTPITDQVDRRNAPVMQLLLLFYGFLLPANWAWRFASGDPVSRENTIIFAVDMLIATLALVSIAMIRRGRFRPAVMLFLAPQLISLGITFSMIGVMPQLIDPAPTMLTLAISGLVLGRRALWVVWGLLMVIFATGFFTNAQLAIDAGDPVSKALRNLPAVLISYTLVTAILDRSINALRESLAESEARGRDLQHEMAERERAQAQLIHAQKLEATGRLASGIAHDFGNILDVILGFSRQRHAAGDLPDARQSRDAMVDSLEGVETAARRGTAITRKLLGFSRADLLKPQTFDLRDAATDLQPMLRQLFPPSVRLSLETGDTPLPVHIDRSELEMMLLNVAANARDAMPEGGTFEVHVLDDDGMAGIRLADSGHGMDAQVVRQIFEPFFSTKDATAGTGLGLSVIQDLVRAVGGDIRVDSTPGAGSIFSIRLPLAGDAAEPAAGARSA
jgi:signal transduction histidine kinase